MLIYQIICETDHALISINHFFKTREEAQEMIDTITDEYRDLGMLDFMGEMEIIERETLAGPWKGVKIYF